jgi:hypothetical protein
VNIPHTVRRAGTTIRPVTSAVNVANPRAEKHGLNAATTWLTDRGRLSDRRIAAHARLWSIYRGWKELSPDQEEVVLQDYFDDGGREPRYYQCNAINAATEATATDQDRLLLLRPCASGIRCAHMGSCPRSKSSSTKPAPFSA